MGLYYFLGKTTYFGCCTKNSKKYLAKYSEQKTSIFWNWPIRFIFEAYMELTVSTLLKLRGDSYSAASTADFFDSALGLFYLVLVFTAPIFAFVFFSIYQENLQKGKAF